MDEKDLNTLFLGTGWEFPVTFDKTTQEASLVSGDKDIKQSLSILLGTTLGERFLHSAFGCNLKDYLFGPLSTTTKTIIRDMIKTAIVRHEPRIDFLGLKLNTEMEANGTLLIEIDYRIRSTNARSNLVYPFYLEEGTNV